MQQFYISRVIGKPFSVKFDGEIIQINSDMVLTVGDVFSVHDGKNAWFVLQNGEQIDVLNKAYMITTKGIIALETSAELVYTKPSDDEESSPQYQLETEGLIQHGLSNTQAQALILARYQEYFNSLPAGENDQAKFEPQVYRIAENQCMNIDVKDLSSFVSGAKSKNFSISSITYEDKECELTYDSEHFTVVPRSGIGQEIKIKIELTNGIQNITGEIVFVVQPIETKFDIKLINHQIKFTNTTERILVANIISEGFDEALIKFNIINDPNNYFFTIENKQLFLTNEGIKAIINKTLSLDEMQVTIRATDNKHTALATIEIPFNSYFQEQNTKSNINPVEATVPVESTMNKALLKEENSEIKQFNHEDIEIISILETKNINENLTESQTSKTEATNSNLIIAPTKTDKTVEKQTSKVKEINKNIAEVPADKEKVINKQQLDEKTKKTESVNNSTIKPQKNEKRIIDKQRSAANNDTLVALNSNARQLKKKAKASPKIITESKLENKTNKNNQNETKRRVNNETENKVDNDNKTPLQGFYANDKKQSQPNILELEKTKQRTVHKEKRTEKSAPVNPNHFYLDKKDLTTEHIANFIPVHDSINLTAILALKEKKDINKHLYIEKDSSGKMMLNVSPTGNGKINNQFVFDDININNIAKFYNLNISDLSEEQISHVIIDSMLENANLIISASKAQPHTESQKT